MNPITKKYNLFVQKYTEIEQESTATEIHDKRVLLRRIFTVLAVCGIKPSKVKNGEKAFKLFGKLRDVQVQRLKLESLDPTPEMASYRAFLQEREAKYTAKADHFSRKKELRFPVIKRKQIIDKDQIVIKVEKSLQNMMDTIRSHSIDDAEDIHRIRIEFKNFRYRVEMLSYLDDIDEAKLELLNMYQDKLGEIQDYEVLINGIRKYCKKRKLEAEDLTEMFEKEQDHLIEDFDSHIELFTLVCRDVIGMRNEE